MCFFPSEGERLIVDCKFGNARNRRYGKLVGAFIARMMVEINVADRSAVRSRCARRVGVRERYLDMLVCETRKTCGWSLRNSADSRITANR